MVGVAPRGVALVDMSGDGTRDLVSVHEIDDTASLTPGNGDGTFGARLDHAVPGDPWDVQIADVTGDGALDLVIPTPTSNTVSVVPGMGGGFGATMAFATD